MRKHSLWHH